MRHAIKIGVLACASLASVSPASAETIFGLTGSGSIVSFDSSTPGVITSNGAISGLPSGTVLNGIDRRPADRQLYSVSTGGTVFRITRDTSGTGYTATSVGTTATAPTGTKFSIDFNPTVDRLRFVSDADQNLRINPTTGAAIVDTPVTLNGSSNIDLVGVGYLNSFLGATTTVLYGIDAFSDSLVRATNANLGTFTNTNTAGVLLAGLGFAVDTADRVGFEISGLTNLGYLTVNDQFYSVNQNTGVATSRGMLGISGITGITSAAVPEPSTWAIMVIGLGAAGFAMRRRTVRQAMPQTA